MLYRESLNSKYSNLGLLCLIVFVMAGLRAIYSSSLTNLFVYWNIFLAIAAFGFIKLFKMLNQNTKLKGKFKNAGLAAIFLGWLSLMPNAIYLVTDIGHLNSPKIYEGSRISNKERNNYHSKRDIPYIYDVVLLFLLALVGLISSGMLTNKMFAQLKQTDLKNYFKFNIFKTDLNGL